VTGLGKTEWIAETPVQFAMIVTELCADLVSLRATKIKPWGEALVSQITNGAKFCRKIKLTFAFIENS